MRYLGHPFSSYTWKGEIALIEKGVDYRFLSVDPAFPDNGALLRHHSPAGKFPLLLDGDYAVFESSIIIEYLDQRCSETQRLIPADPIIALRVRMLDRMIDNYVMGNAQTVVAEHLPFITPRPDPQRIERAKASLLAIYNWLEREVPTQGWIGGEAFTMADCAAAPALFYADWVLDIPPELERLRAYRMRLLARPSVSRCVESARPFRRYFPLGAPDRD